MIKIRDSSLDLKAFIDDYWDDNIHEVINSELDLFFRTVVDDDKSQYIVNGNKVEIDGNFFQIVYVNKQRTSDNLLLIDVEAYHVAMIDLNLPDYNEDFFTVDDTPENIMTEILDGTGYTVGTVEFTDVTTFSIQEKSSRRGILIQFANYMSGELKFDKYEISLLEQRGSDDGVQIRVGKNLKGISKYTDSRSGTTETAFDIDMLELRTLEEYGDLEAVQLGDTIRMIDPDLGIDEKQRIVEYEYSPKLRIDSRIVVANTIDGIEDTITKIQRDTVYKEKVYNGIRIGPENGFVAVRSDNTAKNINNATDGFKLQKGDGTGDNWTDILYFDIDAQRYKFVGDIVMEGGSISWADVNSDPTIQDAQDTADSIANGSYSGGTFIDADTIYAPNVSGGVITGATLTTGANFSVDSAGILEAVDANISGSINMGPGSAISWADVNQDPDISSIADGTYIGGTFIDGTNIYAPNITGGSITSNTTINVGTDLIVGNNVYVGDQGATGTDKYVRLVNNHYLEYDAASGWFGLNAPLVRLIAGGSSGEVFISSGGEVNISPGIAAYYGLYELATLNDISGLQTQITSNDSDITDLQNNKATVGVNTDSTTVDDDHNHGFLSTDYIQCYDSVGNPTALKAFVPYAGSPAHFHNQN